MLNLVLSHQILPASQLKDGEPSIWVFAQAPEAIMWFIQPEVADKRHQLRHNESQICHTRLLRRQMKVLRKHEQADVCLVLTMLCVRSL